MPARELGDVLSPPDHETIVVDWDDFQSRCQEAVGRYNKRMGDDAAGQDYQEDEDHQLKLHMLASSIISCSRDNSSQTAECFVLGTLFPNFPLDPALCFV